MIHVSEQTIPLAFQAFCSRRGRWLEVLGDQLEMYMAAGRAFNVDGQLDDFCVVYEGLQKWQVSRNGQVQDAQAVFGMLGSLNPDLRLRCLSQLRPDDWPIVWDAIIRLRNVKPLESGPSVMAISKFLHFWNPRIFVICDQAVIEQFVFGHWWLADQRDGKTWVFQAAGTNPDEEPELSKYLQLLALASEFVRDNPGILPAFAQTVQANAAGAMVPDDIETYEATATEWCLVGLSQLVPPGVQVEGGVP